MKVLSLFDGIAGARQALKELNIDCEYYASEIDKYAMQVASANHPDILQIGDIKNIFYAHNDLTFANEKGFNYCQDVNFTLLIGGFPCQSFSIAGNRKGLDDERGQLFFEALRILNEVKPKYFLFENVASMSKSNQDFISEKLGVQPVMINSDRFLQQNRERLYWTNIKIDELPKRPNWKGQYYQWRRTYFRENKSGVCPTLTANMGSGGHNVPLKSKNLKDKLSVREVCKLQGFPDGYCDLVSKTQGYKALGNSFTIPVIKHIIKTIYEK
jgi:DNA (cytosine-5)-methyltransferase 3A